MTHTSGTTWHGQAPTLEAIEAAVKMFAQRTGRPWTLISPDGRVWQGSDPWKLAASSGELPEILKLPFGETDGNSNSQRKGPAPSSGSP